MENAAINIINNIATTILKIRSAIVYPPVKIPPHYEAGMVLNDFTVWLSEAEPATATT